MRRIFLTAALLVLPMLAQAHPGHDSGAGFMTGALHPLAGMDHLLALIATGLLAWRMAGRERLRIAVAFPALLAVGAIIGLAGVELPLTETMIALSIAVLALLALRPPRRLPLSAAGLTAMFAVFHGHAHGLEAAGAIAAGSFVAGLMLSSVLVICAAMACAQLASQWISLHRHHRHRLRR
jgi:urease accessory protein